MLFFSIITTPDTTKAPTIASGIPLVAAIPNITAPAVDVSPPIASTYLCAYSKNTSPKTPNVFIIEPKKPEHNPETERF